MEFNQKLQNLRKQKEITQEQLAKALFVSRTAISKWESGRGYPNIDSLKAIAEFFDVTVDDLVSGKEVLDIAQKDAKQKQKQLCTLVCSLLDLSACIMFFVPIFCQKVQGNIYNVSLLRLCEIQPYIRYSFFAFVIAIVLTGLFSLIFQNTQWELWEKIKNKVSVTLSVAAVLLFTMTLQPYPAAFMFIFLVVKVFALLKIK